MLEVKMKSKNCVKVTHLLSGIDKSPIWCIHHQCQACSWSSL